MQYRLRKWVQDAELGLNGTNLWIYPEPDREIAFPRFLAVGDPGLQVAAARYADPEHQKAIALLRQRLTDPRALGPAAGGNGRAGLDEATNAEIARRGSQLILHIQVWPEDLQRQRMLAGRVGSPFSYWMLVAPESRGRPEVIQFSAWVEAEAAATRAAIGDVGRAA